MVAIRKQVVRRRRNALAVCLAFGVTCGSSMGQAGTPPGQPPGLGNPAFGTQDPENNVSGQPNLGADPFDLLRDRLPAGFQGASRELPMFQGFPTLTPPGFTHFPGGALPIPFDPNAEVIPGPLAAPPRSPNSWPTWFRDTDDEQGFTPEVGIIAQATDYVWTRDAEESVWTPLVFFDRFQVLTAGGGVQVRGGGQYTLNLREGMQLRVQGTSEMEIVQLDSERVHLRFAALEWATLIAGDRPVVIEVGNSPPVEFVTTRAVLSRREGLVEVDHRGPGTSQLLRAPEATPIPSLHRLFLMPGAALADVDSVALGLQGAVTSRRSGRVLRVDGGPEGGSVEWMGARIRVPGGAILRLDPLAGDDFPDYRQ